MTRFSLSDAGGGGRIPVKAAAFSLAAALTLYAAWPILWSAPLELMDSFQAMARHPSVIRSLFRGEWVLWPNIPWDYIPAWALATTPPAALALAALGMAVAARLCAARWRGALANSDARFALLAAACLVLPVAAAIALNSNLYNDWRQMYFLHAPLCVLAAFGLNALASIPAPRLRVGALALVAVGIAVVAVPMVNLHPHQNIYFNPPADAERWELDYFNVATKEALEALLEMRPNESVAVAGNFPVDRNVPVDRNRSFLPEDDRRRLNTVLAFPEFIVVNDDIGESAVWRREAGGVAIVSILDSRAESEARWRAAYARARASAPLASAGGFDIYADIDRLIYIKESCAESDTLGTFAQRAIPAVPKDDGKRRREWRFEFHTYGATFDGKCLMHVPIPAYEIATLETMRWTDDEDNPLWRVSFALPKPQAQYAAALSSLPDSPDARAEFDIYADVDRLIYVKSPCAEGDEALGQFRLAVFPADLPRKARVAGLESKAYYFRFHQYGAVFDGKCVMIRKLPDYRISRVETGRREGGKTFWSAEIRFAAYYDRFRRALSKLPANPSARADFDLHADLDARTLTYVKSPCAESDGRGRFFLSVFPADPSDVEAESRERGLAHNSLNFDFEDYGGAFDGKCAAIRELPDYPISRLETGRAADSENRVAEIRFEAYYDRFRRALAALPAEPSARSDFDLHLDSDARTLTYVKSPCAESDVRGRFLLSVFPSDPSDVEPENRGRGLLSNSLNFDFDDYGGVFDGKCAAIIDLPDYRISRVETGRARDRFRRALAALPAEPSARTDFNLYADSDARTLTYVKSPCAEDDIRGRFFLSIFPADPSDVEPENRERDLAHNSLNFDFAEYGGAFDGKCAIIRELPGYPIAALETGQWTTDEGQLWKARIEAGE